MGTPSQPETERNDKIYKEWKLGVSYSQLAKLHNLTAARIGQIVVRAKLMESQGLTINPAGKLSVGVIEEGEPK
jgi:Mor family transcriptional regulator